MRLLRTLLAGSGIIAIAFALGISAPASAETKLERLKKALLEETEEVFGDEVEDLAESRLDRLRENVESTAERLRDPEHEDEAEHILDEWEDGFGDRNHVKKCPVCYDVADDLQDGTGMPMPPQPVVPTRFMINGMLFGADPSGWLYPLHPMTGQPAGPPQGILARSELSPTGWLAFNAFNQPFVAVPAQ